MFKFLPAILFAIATSVQAAATTCPEHFYGGAAPDVLIAGLRARTYALCHTAYAAETSGVTKTGIWSAEHLTRDAVLAAHHVGRVDDFRADLSVPPRDRAELSDYRGNGLNLDRGHLSPSGDAASAQAQDETFLMSQMVPQSHENNSGLWEELEYMTRLMAQRDGEVYVVTGPAFVGTQLRQIGSGVYVPTHMWKAEYSPQRGAGVYVARNAPGYGYSVLSVAQFIQFGGIDPFPALAPAIKNVVGNMPRPRADGLYIEPVSLGGLAAADAGVAEQSASGRPNRPRYGLGYHGTAGAGARVWQ